MSVRIVQRRIKGGRSSLYLDYIINGIRKKENIQLTLEEPKNNEAVEVNEEKLLLAKQICAKREWELIANIYDINLPYPKTVKYNFIEVFEQFIKNYKAKDTATAKATLTYLKLFSKRKTLLLEEINKNFCENFYSFLQENLRGNTPQSYFKKFRMCLSQCVENNMISKNPAKDIKLINGDEFTKNILSAEEIQQIANVKCIGKKKEIKRAFLFSCNTGLRWCDIYRLKYSAIDYENCMLNITQNKVKMHSSKAILHLNLNRNAIRLLQMKRCNMDEKVFRLYTYTYSLKLLEELVKEAGINKHITFHCGRHSFITNIILTGANIKTASELAGHSTIRHTEKYVHLVDELKLKAVNRLPEIKF